MGLDEENSDCDVTLILTHRTSETTIDHDFSISGMVELAVSILLAGIEVGGTVIARRPLAGYNPLVVSQIARLTLRQMVGPFRIEAAISTGRLAPVQIKIAARHGHLSEEHQKQLQEKAEKLLHYFARITMIEITVDLQDKITKGVEIRVDAEHKHDFVAKDSHEDVLVALDLAIDRIKHQVNRYKDKIQDHRRDPSHNGD